MFFLLSVCYLLPSSACGAPESKKIAGTNRPRGFPLCLCTGQNQSLTVFQAPLNMFLAAVRAFSPVKFSIYPPLRCLFCFSIACAVMLLFIICHGFFSNALKSTFPIKVRGYSCLYMYSVNRSHTAFSFRHHQDLLQIIFSGFVNCHGQIRPFELHLFARKTGCQYAKASRLFGGKVLAYHSGWLKPD